MKYELLGKNICTAVFAHLNKTGDNAASAGDYANFLLSVFLLEHSRRINILVFKERKRLSFAHDDRGKERRNL